MGVEGTLETLGSLGTLATLGTLGAKRTLLTLRNLVTLMTLGTLVMLVMLGILVTLMILGVLGIPETLELLEMLEPWGMLETPNTQVTSRTNLVIWVTLVTLGTPVTLGILGTLRALELMVPLLETPGSPEVTLGTPRSGPQVGRALWSKGDPCHQSIAESPWGTSLSQPCHGVWAIPTLSPCPCYFCIHAHATPSLFPWNPSSYPCPHSLGHAIAAPNSILVPSHLCSMPHCPCAVPIPVPFPPLCDS